MRLLFTLIFGCYFIPLPAQQSKYSIRHQRVDYSLVLNDNQTFSYNKNPLSQYQHFTQRKTGFYELESDTLTLCVYESPGRDSDGIILPNNFYYATYKIGYRRLKLIDATSDFIFKLKAPIFKLNFYPWFIRVEY